MFHLNNPGGIEAILYEPLTYIPPLPIPKRDEPHCPEAVVLNRGARSPGGRQ